MASLRSRTAAPGLPLRLITLAQPFLLASALLGLVATLGGNALASLEGSVGSAMATLFLAGWIGLTVAASLLHLLAMLARVRSGFAVAMPAPQPVQDRVVAGTAAIGVLALALSALLSTDTLATAGRLLVLLAAAAVAARLARSAVVVVKPGRAPAGPGAIR